MGHRARNQGGTFEYIVDAEADLAAIPNPRTSEFALAMSEKTIWVFTGSAWEQVGGGGGGAPTNADYLVGTANGSLSAEIVAGTAPGGELGGTWASPTVDATHAGSTHITDHGALGGLADDDHPQYATDTDLTNHEAAADPHTGYVREADANWVDLTDGGGTVLHSHAGGGAHTIQDAGVSETQRTNLDFQDGFIVTDNAGADATEVDLDYGTGATQPAAGNHTHAGAGHTIKDAGVSETQRANLDFQDGFEVTDNAGADSTDVDLSYGAAGYPQDVAASEADGTAITVARADHVHAHGSGYSADAHHARSHDHSAAGDGTTLTPATLNVPNAAAPAPTAEGQMAWDNDGNFIVVGDGAATKEFFPTVDATSDPAAVSTAAADGTEATVARKDHVHAHEAAHINHDTTWAAKGDLIVASANDTASVVTVGANDTILMADSAQANGVKWAAAATTTEIADVADAEAAGTSDTYARGDHVHSGAAYLKESDVDAVAFSIGAFIDGGGSAISTGVRPIWRAPFACTVTQVRGYVDTGTTTVINACKDATGTNNFCSADITIDPADAWESGTVNQNQSVSAGDTVSVEVVTAGTATQCTIQIEFTRDLSP